jgi:hypothetical protein
VRWSNLSRERGLPKAAACAEGLVVVQYPVAVLRLSTSATARDGSARGRAAPIRMPPPGRARAPNTGTL